MNEPIQNDEALRLHRDAIDAIDDAVLRLLSERGRHAKEIGHIKSSAAIWRPEREVQILDRVIAANEGPLPNETITALYRQIMSACRALEKELAVSYLGPAGTFSELAVFRQFGNFTRAIPCATLDEALRQVEAGACDYAVLPIENSTEGAVGRTHDLMIDTTLSICAEIQLRIQQNLLSVESEIEKIEKVFSHPQSLAQCSRWLSLNLPHVTQVPVSSNAEAARLAAETPSAAAIAGETAAQHYHLNVLRSHIEDMPNNTTRFWALGVNKPNPTGHDLTSMVLAAPNVAGAIYHLLEPFTKNGVSMTRLESRPSRSGMWEYFFFIDVEGHQKDPAVSAALAELKKVAPFVKVLGSYPKFM
jgi:chorismate mutase/prephenate dehydratase